MLPRRLSHTHTLVFVSRDALLNVQTDVFLHWEENWPVIPALTARAIMHMDESLCRASSHLADGALIHASWFGHNPSSCLGTAAEGKLSACLSRSVGWYIFLDSYEISLWHWRCVCSMFERFESFCLSPTPVHVNAWTQTDQERKVRNTPHSNGSTKLTERTSNTSNCLWILIIPFFLLIFFH